MISQQETYILQRDYNLDFFKTLVVKQARRRGYIHWFQFDVKNCGGYREISFDVSFREMK